jgi:hypothetical protein
VPGYGKDIYHFSDNIFPPKLKDEIKEHGDKWYYSPDGTIGDNAQKKKRIKTA